MQNINSFSIQPSDAQDGNPKAFFISPDGNIYPDQLICSGLIPVELKGKECPYSKNGRIPKPVPLKEDWPDYSIDKGNPGDLCPPCAKQQLSSLGHWESNSTKHFPDHLLPLRLFKCRQWFWFVIPELLNEQPNKLQPSARQ